MSELPGRPHISLFSLVVAAQARHAAHYWALTLLMGTSSGELEGVTGGGERNIYTARGLESCQPFVERFSKIAQPQANARLSSNQ